MIDGIEILKLPTTIQNLEIACIDIKQTVNATTGVVYKKSTAYYKGLALTIFPNRIMLKGSLPAVKYGNNVCDLSLSELRTTIKEMEHTFNFDAATTPLNGFEFGVNIETPFSPDYFLDDIIAWGRTEAQRWKGKEENYVQFTRTQVNIKIYSKSKQYKLSKNLLRFEIKVKKCSTQIDLGSVISLIYAIIGN